MNKYLLIILVIASILRIGFLNTHVSALYGDEISIGYNAWSILKTGKDEFSKTLPIQFESWGDQKNPVYIYLVSIFQIFMGLSFWSVRLPSALAGVLTIYLTYLLTKLLFLKYNYHAKPTENDIETIALVAAGLLAINPWHIHISRGGYEANLALLLGLSGIYFFLKWFFYKHNQQTVNITYPYFYISLVSFVLAMYTYYTTKMFVPLIIAVLFLWASLTTKIKGKEILRDMLLYLSLFVIACLPVIYLALFAQGQARFAKINIFNNESVVTRVIQQRTQFEDNLYLAKIFANKPFVWFGDFLEYFFDNLSPLFWYVKGDSSLRYSIGEHGMFYLFEAPFFLLGLLYLWQYNKKIAILLLTWLFLSIIPTALVGKSYGLRSIAMLPVPMIIAAFGIYGLLQSMQTRNIKTSLVKYILVLSLIFSLGNWLVRYAYAYPSYGHYWYDGMQKDAIEYAKRREGEFENIIISRKYGKTEMYYAFYENIDPSQYQTLSTQKQKIGNDEMIKFGKYYFGDIDIQGRNFNELNIPPKTLVISAPEFPFGQETITARDDRRVLFKILVTE